MGLEEFRWLYVGEVSSMNNQGSQKLSLVDTERVERYWKKGVRCLIIGEVEV